MRYHGQAHSSMSLLTKPETYAPLEDACLIQQIFLKIKKDRGKRRKFVSLPRSFNIFGEYTEQSGKLLRPPISLDRSPASRPCFLFFPSQVLWREGKTDKIGRSYTLGLCVAFWINFYRPCKNHGLTASRSILLQTEYYRLSEDDHFL
jgi:hypothetical protein